MHFIIMVFIKEGNLIRGVGLEAVSGGTIDTFSGLMNNYELAFDGDPNTFAIDVSSNFSRNNYNLLNELNIRKIKVDYEGRNGDPAFPNFYLWDALDVELAAIDAPTLASNDRRTFSFDVNAQNTAKIRTEDPSGSRVNIYEISLYTIEASTEIPTISVGDTVFIEGCGYATVLTNVDGNVTLETSSHNAVPLWVNNTNGGSYATNDIINYNGVLYKNSTGTNLDTTPELDSTNWAAFISDTIDSVPLWSSATNGGSYDIDDIINYNGVLYKNNTGTNTDVTPNTDLTDWEVLDASISHSTGVQLGGVLSVGSPNTTFSISDGFGYIIDNMTDPFNPEAERINWSGLTNIAATNIATQLITFISIDLNGAVIQQASRWSNSERRDRIIIGVIVHVDNISIDVVNNEQQVGQDAVSQIYDILNGLGFINVEGNVFGANGSNLLINKTAGTMLGSGINYANNINNPHQLILPGLTQANFQYRLQNGTNLTGLTNQTIDPDFYDVGGVATPVPGKKYTIQHIYSFTSNNVKIQPGQGVYNKIDDAIVAINSDAFVTEQSIKENGLLRGYLIIKEGTNDLTDAKKVRFIEASNIPGSKGGSSGASVLLSAVPLWKSSSNGGSYLLNDIINYNGILYKNLTSDNLDTTPDLDTTNWVALASTSLSDNDGDTSVEVERTTDDDTVYIKTNGVDRLTTDASGTTSRGKIKINNGQFASINYLDIGFNGTTGIASFESIGNGNTSMEFYSSNGGSQNLGLKIDKDQNVTIPQNLTTDTFSTAWVNNTNGGVYTVDDIVIYIGGFYKNLTGVNLDTIPNLDTTNWVAIGGSDVVPLWKSDTNGGSYAVSDLINHSGVIYKNKTGVNTDIDPTLDTTNWKRLDEQIASKTTIGRGLTLRSNWPLDLQRGALVT